MNIAVLIKQVVDVTFHFDLQPETNLPHPDDLFYMINPADLSASECALQLNEKWGGEVLFISLGPLRVRHALVSVLAMGGTRAIHVCDKGLGRSSLTAAHILAQVVRPLACDLILCGTHSLDEGSGEVPAALAEVLDLPQVTGVLGMEITSGGTQAIVERRMERGRRQTIGCQLPAVFAIDPWAAVPRYASLPRLLEAYAGKNISQVESQTLGVDPSQPGGIEERRRLVGLSLPRPRPKKTFAIDGSLSADERMELIMSGGMTRRASGQVLEGEPFQVARQLATTLLHRKLVG